MHRALLVAAGCLAATGCQRLVAPADAAAPAAPAAVWMFKNFSWGVQCPDPVAAPSDAPPRTLQGVARTRSDAGPPPLGPQVDACFSSQAAPGTAVDCVAKPLAGAGVTVLERRVETMSVCEACGCPANALRLHLRVAPAAQAALEAAGFKVRSRPPPPAE